MTFYLKRLGPFRVERTEDWNNDPDNSYAEMIRVRGSKTEPPDFMVPSHLYKYSESELALYMKDHKNLWRELGNLLNEEIDIHESELMIHFSISMFPKVAEIVPFVRKRGLSGNSDLAKLIGRETQFTKDTRHKMKQNDKITGMKGLSRPITLDTYSKNMILGRK